MQLEAPEWDEYWPNAQPAQVIWPSRENVPIPQRAQDACPAALFSLPGEQAAQFSILAESELGGANIPAGHAVQAPEPSAGA